MLEDITIKKIKNMSCSELTQLAQEIRSEIIQVTSKNGGHLASNLGVVELTIALHKVFEAPLDKIIFDVSHQTYTHKILTGRYDKFKTLRQYKGLSGFCKYSESEYDAFESGHSSTSLSAGIGFLEAKKTNPDKVGRVITVVGDASVSNGLCFEALNYLSEHKEDKMIIIINDNNMSISKNVGGLARKYNSIRLNRGMKLFKAITPMCIKNGMQYFAYRTNLFTSMGFKYFECIDGHDIKELIKYFSYAKAYDKTIILHVKTNKGMGYLPAEQDTLGVWHGVGPFDVETGEVIGIHKKLSFGQVISNKICEMLDEKQADIKVISPAMTLGSGLSCLEHRHKDSIIDVGIAEENGLVIASSMSLSGVVPVVFIYSTFLQRAYDELIHDIARPSLHVVICVDRAGIVPQDGSTHQGIYDMAFLESIPGITVLQPVTSIDASRMIEDAVNKISGPVVIRYPKGSACENGSFYNSHLNWEVIKHGSIYCLSYGPDLLDIIKYNDENNCGYGIICATNTSIIDKNVINNLPDNSKIFVYETVIEPSSLGMRLRNYIYKNNLKIQIFTKYIESGYLEEGTVEDLKKEQGLLTSDFFEFISKNK